MQKIIFSILLGLVLLVFFGALFYNVETDLGNGFKYYDDYKCIFSPDELADIVPEIIWHKNDKDFIMAKTRPRKLREYLYNYNDNYNYSLVLRLIIIG